MVSVKNAGKNLKQYVPIYIITLFGLIQALVNTLASLDPTIAFWVLIGLIIFAFIFTMFAEGRKDVDDKWIKALVNAVSGGLWLGFINIKILMFNAGQIGELIFEIIVIIWTFIITFEVQPKSVQNVLYA
jgi:hypothetical protein